MTRIDSYGWGVTIREHPDVPAWRPHVIAAVARRTTIPSFITRTLTLGARWSHLACADLERGVMIEALVFRGVVETPLGEWLERYPSHEFFRTECPRPDLALEYWRECAAERRPYDYGGALGTVWRLCKLQDPNAQFCNELFEEGLAAGGRRRFRLGGGVRLPPTDSWMIL